MCWFPWETIRITFLANSKLDEEEIESLYETTQTIEGVTDLENESGDA